MNRYRVRHARALRGYRVEVIFADGVRGRVDLSPLVGKGVFEAWQKPGFFRRVFVDPVSGALAWPGGIDLCPHTLYLDITGSRLLRASRRAAQRRRSSPTSRRVVSRR